MAELAEAAQLASLADETPEGRSVVALAKEKYGLRAPEMADTYATFVPFSAQTRMSGVDLFDGHQAAAGRPAQVKHGGAPASPRIASGGSTLVEVRQPAIEIVPGSRTVRNRA